MSTQHNLFNIKLVKMDRVTFLSTQHNLFIKCVKHASNNLFLILDHSCPACNNSLESIIHLLRDYPSLGTLGRTRESSLTCSLPSLNHSLDGSTVQTNNGLHTNNGTSSAVPDHHNISCCVLLHIGLWTL